MSKEKKTKLNRLITGWPGGTLATASFLNAWGYSSALLGKYRKSGWIASLKRGAYIRHGDTVEWQGGLFALQKQMGLNIHAGGKTALELKGYAHYLPDRIQKVFLYGSSRTKLPSWFTSHDWRVDILFSSTGLFPEDFSTGLTEHKETGFSITISATERAMMEMLYHVPGKADFEEALLIMENLPSLRADIVEELLRNCCFVKVNRLFMYMAERNRHPWVQDLDLSGVNFGKGKRVIVKNGSFDKKYQITVPRHLNGMGL